jgi:DHA1 family multidrug resistance protein-like MFS transporter
MVVDLLRDSPFGHLVRLVSRGKLLQYPEERDPSLWKRYVNQEKSGFVAHHGNTQEPGEEVEELSRVRGIRERDGHDSETSSHTRVGEGHNEASGVRVDTEKGKDAHVIDWDGPDDPQVRIRLLDVTQDGANRITEPKKLVST